MAEVSWFFESPATGTNEYTTSDMAEWLWEALGLRANGILPNIDAVILPSSTGALNSTYAAGVAIFNGRVYKNTTPLALTHVAPNTGYKRIDTVVIRFDNVTNYAANLTIIQGVQKNDGSQVAPGTNSGTDILVANVLIDGTAANTTTVTDLRAYRKHAGDMLPVYSTDSAPATPELSLPSLQMLFKTLYNRLRYTLVSLSGTGNYTIPSTYNVGEGFGIQVGNTGSFLITPPSGQVWLINGVLCNSGYPTQNVTITNTDPSHILPGNPVLCQRMI